MTNERIEAGARFVEEQGRGKVVGHSIVQLEAGRDAVKFNLESGKSITLYPCSWEEATYSE